MCAGLACFHCTQNVPKDSWNYYQAFSDTPKLLFEMEFSVNLDCRNANEVAIDLITEHIRTKLKQPDLR